MHLTNVMQSKSGTSDPNLTQRGKFKGREVHLLNYIMNTIFSGFPYQYKSMINKYFFLHRELVFYNSKSKLFEKTYIVFIILLNMWVLILLPLEINKI